MPSSWRWSNDEEFRENVFPHALNENDHVRRAAISNCFAENCRDLFDNARKLRDGCEELTVLLEENQDEISEALGIAIEMCQDGEEMLLFQRRLAVGMGAYGFLHGKEAIEHFCHKTSKPTSRHDLERFCDDVFDMLQAFDSALLDDAKFLADEVRDLPEHLEADFLKARDLCSVGFEEVGVMLCGRGFEKVVREILARRNIQVASGNRSQPASKAMLHDLLGAMGKLKYKDDGNRLFSPQSLTLMHWIREVRNGVVHEGEEEVSADERTTAAMLAQISARLWAAHIANESRALDETSIRKDW